MRNGKKALFVLASVFLASAIFGCKPTKDNSSTPASSSTPTSETSVSDTSVTSNDASTSSESSSSSSIAHTFGPWTITKEPTLTEGGTATRSWTDDPTHTEEMPLPVLTDTTVWTKTTVTAPTCEGEGKDKYTSEYGEVEVTVPATNHAYGEWVITVKPTLTATGTAERVCDNDAEHVDSKTLPALTDTTVWTKTVVTAPTCDVDGKDKYTSEYGEVEVTVPATNHAYGEWVITVKPTLTATGTAERVCDNDAEHVDSKTLPALTDTAVWTKTVVTAPTCEGEGKDKYTSEYGEVEVTTEAIGHEYGAWVIKVNPTATTEGSAERVCSHDATHVDKATLPVLTDTSVWSISESLEATNYEGGYTTFTSEFGSVTITSERKYGEWEFKDTNLTFGGQTTLVKHSNIGLEDIEKIVSVPTRTLQINVTTGDFEKYKLEQGQDYYFVENNGTFTSNNVNMDSTIASMTFTPKVDGVITYTIDCSSETNYDYFYDSVDDSKKIGKSSGEKTVITRTLKANETYTFFYKKDSSGKGGEDKAVISNFIFECLDTSSVTKDEFVIIDYTSDGEILDPMIVIKNTKSNLLDYKKEGYLLEGWYDKTFTNRYTSNTVFSEHSVLHAKWVESYKVTLVLDNGEDNLDCHFKKGEVATLDEPYKKGYIFIGWYTSSDFASDSLFDPETSTQDNIVLYAKYDKAPDYVGAYASSKEIYYETSTNVVRYSLVIDEKGNITNFGSSSKKGTVTSFDKETGRMECVIGGVATFMYYYDGIIIAPTTLSTDFFGDELLIASKVSFSKFGYYSFKDANNKYTTKIIGIVSGGKTYCIGVINNQLYFDLIVTDIENNVIDMTSMNSTTGRNLKSFVVKDSSGTILLAKGKDSAYSTWEDLVAPFGTYTSGENSITLDGKGKYTDSNSKNGNYTVIDSENNVIGVTIGYGENVSEYFEYTLNEDHTFTVVKPMVTITFNTGTGHEALDPLEVNKNVPLELVTPKEEADYVFEGWYVDPKFRVKITDKYTPTNDVTIYAKYVTALKLSIYENKTSASDPIVKRYAMNDIVTVDDPSKTGYIFAGWYTTPTFEAGSEWTSGSEITENISIYAKYELTDSYVGDYTGAYFSGSTTTSGVSSVTGNETLTINSDLTGSFTNRDTTFEFDANDPTKLTITKYRTSTYTNTYNGWWNESNRLLVAISTTTSSSVYLFSGNGETDIVTDNVKSSYWNSGKTRIISYTDQNNVAHLIFVHEGNVYFNVKVLDSTNTEVTDITTVYSLTSTTIITDELKFMFVSSDSGLVLDKTEQNINLNGSYGMQNVYPLATSMNSLSSEIVVTDGNKITVPELNYGALNNTEFTISTDSNELSIGSSSSGYYGAFNKNIIVMCQKDSFGKSFYDSYIGCKLNDGEDVSKLSTKVHVSGEYSNLNFYAVSFYYDGVLRDSVFCDGTNVYVGVEFVFEGSTTEIGSSGTYKVYYNSNCIYEVNNGQMTAVNA